MRAAVLGQDGRVRVEEAPDPKPKGQEVLLRVTYCGVCGSDLHMLRAGLAPPGAILGHEITGVVEDLGTEVEGLEVGDRVTILSAVPCGTCEKCVARLYRSCEAGWQVFGYTGLAGGYAELLLTHASVVEKAPDEISDLAAAFNEPAIVGLHAVRISNLRPGDTSAILGAGPIGLLVLQAARLANPGPVYVVEPSAGRKEKALRLGATAALDPFKDDLADFFLNNTAVGPDVVFECAGAPKTLQTAVELVRPGGQVVVPGVNMEDDELMPLTMLMKECEVRGSLGGGDLFRTALDYLAGGLIEVEPMVTRIVELEELDELFQTLGTPASDEVKVLVAPNGKAAAG